MTSVRYDVGKRHINRIKRQYDLGNEASAAPDQEPRRPVSLDVPLGRISLWMGALGFC